jgi:hypothetical protein
MTTCAFRGKGPFGSAAALASLPHWCVAALRRWQARWAAVLVLVVGVVLLGTSKARLDWADRSARIQRGPSVLAVVTASKVREADARAPHHDTDYTVTFTNPDGGRTETAVVTRAFVSDPHPNGRLLQVSFDPAHPERAEVTGHPMHTRAEVWWVALTGVAFTLAGGGYLFLGRLPRPNAGRRRR